MAIPSLVALKRLSGDRDPLLSSWDKLTKAIELSEPPFDGTCQKCAARPAQVAVEIELSVLSERVLSDETGPPVAVREHRDAPPAKATPEGETEYWQSLTIPHLLCEQCHADFAAMYRWRTAVRCAILLAGIILAPLAILIVVVGRFASHLSLTVVGSLMGVLLAFLWFTIQRRWKKDPRLSQWLRGVPLVKDVLETEDEYMLRKRRTVLLAETR